MKKVLSILFALTLVLVMTIPIMAETPSGGTSIISYSVAPSYTISIPTEGVTISGASATANVAVNPGSLINANQHLEFSISGATNYDTAEEDNVGFRLVNGLLGSVYLHYAISCAGNEDILKNDVFLNASATEVNNGKSVLLTFTPDTATQAGTYTDTITFKIATMNNT